MSDDSQLSDYSFADKLIKNIAIYAPITLEEIAMIITNTEIMLLGTNQVAAGSTIDFKMDIFVMIIKYVSST